MKKIYSLLLIISVVGAVLSPASAQILSKSKRGVTPRPVERNIFGKAEAYSDGNGAFIRWQMAVEAGNVGFNVYRLSRRGEQLVSEHLILGSKARVGSDPQYGETYSYFDPSGSIGDVYRVESLDASGRRLSSEKVSAAYTSELKTIAGRSSAEFVDINAKRKQSFVSSDLTLPKDLSSEVEASLLAPDPVNQKVIAATPGVKLGVRTDGFYRVTKAQLQSAGFNVASDPANWQLYCDGNEQAIQVDPNGDFIEFIGKAKETIESDTHYYYLIVGNSAGRRMQTRVSRPVGSTVVSNNYHQTTFVKQRTNYVSDILNGDAENYWGNVVSSTSGSFSFNLSGIDTNAGNAEIVVKLQGFSFTPHSVLIKVNGQEVATAIGNGTTPFSAAATIPVSALAEGVNILGMTTGSNTDYALFDSVSVSFNRKYQAYQDQVWFYTPNYKSANLTGFDSSSIRVFDVTDDGLAVELNNLNITNDNGNFGVKLPPNRGRSYFAVEASAVKNVATIEFNTPSTLSTPNHNAQLVIITYPAFAAAAQSWAQYRQGQGISTEVVDVRDIYDEYEYGQSSSASIKNFLQYAANNWQTPPQYVLLLGDASYDCKNYEGLGYTNLVPTKIVNTVYTETGSDDALADFDGDGLTELSIGRIPAQTSQDVTNALAKVQAFEQPSMQDLNRGAIFAYDVTTVGGYDFQAMSVILRDSLPVGTPNVMIGRGDANSQTTLINEINNGRYVVNYSGHGTATTWATLDFFGTPTVASLTNANTQSIFTMLTCLNGYFINPYADSLAESLLKAQNGGSVAAWASTGKTTPDIQLAMGTRFYTQLGVGNLTRLGDLVRDAKSVIPGGRDVRFSWALFGDPMLKVRP